jgi:hypothetical protein
MEVKPDSPTEFDNEIRTTSPKDDRYVTRSFAQKVSLGIPLNAPPKLKRVRDTERIHRVRKDSL